VTFYRLEPWGCRIEDQRFGLLASLIVNAVGGKAQPDEFFVRTEHELRQIQDAKKRNEARALFEEIKASFAGLNASREASSS